MKIVIVCKDNEVKFTNLKERIKSKFDDGKAWFKRNKGTVIVLAPIIISGVATIAKVAGKHINLHKEENLKNLYCYDRSLGHYWRLRRELSNKEWIEIEHRKRNGETLANILSDLRVLK